MKRLLILSLITCGALATTLASPVSPETALSRLQTEGVRRAHTAAPAPKYQGPLNDADGNASLYVFTWSGNEGFMLLPADDCVAPLLGYSETGSFQIADAPESLRWWLQEYSDQIEVSSKAGMKYKANKDTRAAGNKEIKPMLTTKWDQSRPFNNECPEVNGWRCVTGCVATAMAQVMNYWEYPASGKGSITYTPVSLPDKELSIDFSSINFDWENMLDVYTSGYSNASAHAVSSLMRACGYSVRMRYTQNESGALAQDIPGALTNYFSYDKGVSRKVRSNYKTQEEWDELIYNELLNVGPVILGGQSINGGHSFVCDGYDGNGYFHINWGWHGISDGYFLLNALNPTEVGTGGHLGGYNSSQDAITGIMPPVGRLSFVSAAIDNAADDTGNVKGWGYTYRINDFSNILVSLKLKVTDGHVSLPLYATVNEIDPDTKQSGREILNSTFGEPINANEGTITWSGYVHMPEFDPSKFYMMKVSYDLKGQRTYLGEGLRFAASSGVDPVVASNEISLRQDGNLLIASAETNVRIELFDIRGQLIKSAGGSPCMKVDLLGLSSGVYVAAATDDEGRRSVVKLLLR